MSQLRCIQILTVCLLTAFVFFNSTTTSEAQSIDKWSQRAINLETQGRHKDVIVAVWDTGVDIEIFKKRNIWTNSKESLSGSDSDGNGYVDDLNGIAFDLKEDRTVELLMPLPSGLDQKGLKRLAKESKGNRDLVLGIVSDESKEVFRSGFSNSKEENAKIADQLIWHGEYSHGTLMAHICILGNPFAQILTIRQQFSHRPPLPTLAGYKKRAKVYADVVNYLKANKVRVANLSWSRWPELHYNALVRHKIGESMEERVAMAKKLFSLEKEALMSAIKGAPEILFVTSAGNTGNGRSDKAIPQSLRLPNVISVGAVNSDGDQYVTNKNAFLDVSARGHKVKSKLPGGLVVQTLGTSVSTAQVSNLAAKILAINPELSVSEVKRLIIETSTVTGKKNEKVLLIHPKNAVNAAKGLAKQGQKRSN